MHRFAGVLSMLHGLRKSTEPKSVMPSKEELMAVYEGLRMSAYGNIIVKPETESAVEFLRQKGLVAIETEFFMDGTRGLAVKRYARWIAGWSCQSCVHAETCPTNKGTWIHDSLMGKRCQKFVHRRLMEALDDVS